MHLMVQKSKPVTTGRKRRKHSLAEMPSSLDAKMTVEEEKDDKQDGGPLL